MPENGERESQERFDWYKVNSLLLDIGNTAADLKMKPTDMVHLGGSAMFYRCYQAFGPKAVSHFRGTHDMDLLCFNRGAVQRVLDVLMTSEDSAVEQYSVGNSSSLPNKRSFYIELKRQNLPGSSTGFEIDVYESEKNEIIFNERVMKRNKLVLDPPEELKLPTLNPQKDRGLVTVPSLRDAFIVKMDIMDFSYSGLRLKDSIDILTTLSVCQALDCSFESLLSAIVEANKKNPALRKLGALEALFRDPQRIVGKANLDNPFIPSDEIIKSALESVRKYRRKLTSG